MINTNEFEKRFGCKAERDDLDRVNCSHAGSVGHYHCGVCSIHNKPRFMCGCLGKERKEESA
jgi:hypothetical protein